MVNTKELGLNSLSVAQYLYGLNKALAVQAGRIKGEVTSFNNSGKGVYFTIKDKTQDAKLDCSIWLNIYQANGINLKVGDEIIITGVPEVYAPYGRFSFRTTTIEYAGEGALKRAFDELKAKLSTEGLLGEDRKRALPLLPKKIGLITSMSSGVVIHDFSSNLDRHGYKIITCDSKVEGKEAVHDLLAAMKAMSKQDIEMLIIIRGGGSIEALQAFNTESVVRAIASLKVPVLTGIGHDVDVTLAQLVADMGASTPTAVAEALNSQWDGLRSQIDVAESKTFGRLRSAIQEKARFIDSTTGAVVRTYEKRLSNARSTISGAALKATSLFRGLSDRVRSANAGLQAALGVMRATLRVQKTHLNKTPLKLSSVLSSSLQDVKKQISAAGQRLVLTQTQVIKASDKRLREFERSVGFNDPARNLRLGYSLSYINGKLARHLSDVAVGDQLSTRLADGDLISEVKELK